MLLVIVVLNGSWRVLIKWIYLMLMDGVLGSRYSGWIRRTRMVWFRLACWLPFPHRCHIYQTNKVLDEGCQNQYHLFLNLPMAFMELVVFWVFGKVEFTNATVNIVSGDFMCFAKQRIFDYLFLIRRDGYRRLQVSTRTRNIL